MTDELISRFDSACIEYDEDEDLMDDAVQQVEVLCRMLRGATKEHLVSEFREPIPECINIAAAEDTRLLFDWTIANIDAVLRTAVDRGRVFCDGCGSYKPTGMP